MIRVVHHDYAQTFPTIMLILDAQKITLICLKNITIMLHYPHIKKMKFRLLHLKSVSSKLIYYSWYLTKSFHLFVINVSRRKFAQCFKFKVKQV